MKRKLNLTVIVALLICFVSTGIASAKIPAEKEYTNSLGIKFVRIEPGCLSGSNRARSRWVT